MPADLSRDIRRKLAGVLGMLGSAHAGERDNAAQLASRMVRAAGLTWDDLIVDPEPEALPPPSTWQELAAQCRAYPAWLSEWEHDFLTGLSRRRRLSVKQLATLERIVLRLRSRGVPL